MVPKQINKLLFYYKRSQVLAMASCIFGFIYHFCFLLVFHFVKVPEMFFFNIISVTVFSALLLTLSKNKFKLIHYCIAYLEVVSHQILANYFLGNLAGFHFFILLMGVIPFILFENRFKAAIFFGIFSSVIFIIVDMLTPYFIGKYAIPFSIIGVIRAINLSVSVTMIMILLLAFSYIVYTVENNLEDQVTRKSKEALAQHQKVYQLQDHIIFSLASLVENRDTDTGDHINRTSAYVRLIAEEALRQGYEPEKLNKNYIELLVKAAPMHDIGKIVVSDAVLKKPGRLTPEEFDSIKLHTTEGGKIISDVMKISDNKNYVQIAYDVATSHHERWDGTGYPYKYFEKEIPLCARIMAIADVFDALVSPRCYKDPMPQEKAFQIIKDEAGTHFDPELVKIFLSVKTQAVKILEKYSR